MNCFNDVLILPILLIIIDLDKEYVLFDIKWLL